LFTKIIGIYCGIITEIINWMWRNSEFLNVTSHGTCRYHWTSNC